MDAYRMLGEVVDIFYCCIFTWKVLTTMLPAFFLAGAVAAFISSASVIKYFGPTAPKPVAYGTAAVSGVLLSLCSCNIVPLFVSIYRRGAGLGPAITFLYAGPAINVLSLIWVIRVIGWRIGIYRGIAVPVLAIIIGLLMAAVFERNRSDADKAEPYYGDERTIRRGPLLSLMGLLLALVIVGGLDDLALSIRLSTSALLATGILLALRFLFTREEVGAWLRETWNLVRLVVPILAISVLVIGLIVKYVPIRWVFALVGNDSPWSVLGAAVFASLMYFPILSEGPFVKSFLQIGMTVGPALAILLLGPGLSLPGMIIVRKVLGTRRLLAYVAGLISLVVLTSLSLSLWMGDYVCPCMLPDL
jgi:uncharacterized membrane protein YraQ (UPF0718 family)